MPKPIRTIPAPVDPIVLRACIEKRFRDLNQPSENSRAAYNAIIMVINQILSGGVYINELVQNADDAGADTICMKLLTVSKISDISASDHSHTAAASQHSSSDPGVGSAS